MNSAMLLSCVAILLVSVTNSYAFSKGSKVFALGNKISQPQIRNTNQLCMTTSSSDSSSTSIFDWFQKLVSSFTNGGSSSAQVSKNAPEPPAPKQPKVAVLILGGTGKAGQEIVKAITLTKKDVVLANRKNAEKGLAVLSQLPELESDHLFPRFNVDVTDKNTLTPEVFEGVEAIVSCIGPSRSEERLNAEAVDFNGNLNLIAAAKQLILGNNNTNKVGPTFKSIYNFEKPLRNLSQWVRLDDVIMGGRSQSQWSAVDWAGEGVS